jgi:hypothetical protein
MIQPKYDKKLSWNSIFGIMAKLQAGEFRVQILVEARYFSSPLCPDQLYGLPSPQFNGYWGLIPRCKAAWV